MNLRMPAIAPANGPRRLTGRGVFLLLVGFFGFVTIVNIAMIRAAVSTFGGVDTPSSYQAGLDFKYEEAAAEAQRALGWTVDGNLTSAGGDLRTLTVEIVDKTGEPVAGVDLEARLAHPVDARQDVAFAMSSLGHGRYSGTSEVHTGQWRLEIAVSQDGVRQFRSRNRISVR